MLLAVHWRIFPSFSEFIFKTPPERVFQTTCFEKRQRGARYAGGRPLFLPASARSVVIVDALQFLLFFLLRFTLVYSPVTRDHFTANHLLVTQLMALYSCFLFPLGCDCLGATSRAGGFTFLRTRSPGFLGFRFIGYLPVRPGLLHLDALHFYCSLWDVPSHRTACQASPCTCFSPAQRQPAKCTTER